MDLVAQGEWAARKNDAKIERTGIPKIAPGAYFGGKIPEAPKSSGKPKWDPTCESVGKACALALFDTSAFDGRVSRLDQLDDDGGSNC